MRLSDASVVIRPRTTWEAMDLGVLLARKHRVLLMSSGTTHLLLYWCSGG